MRSYRKLWLAAAAILFINTQASAVDKLRIGTEGAYPPFNHINASRQPVGFDIDIAHALCAKMRVECEIVTVNWQEIIPALNSGRFDFLAASMSITQERSQIVDFTKPYYTDRLQFIAPQSSTLTIDQQGLSGKAIAVQRETVASTWLQESFGNVVNIRLYDTQEAAYADLAAGKIDGMLADRFTQWEWLQGKAGKAFEFKGEPVYDNDRIGIAVRKGDNSLREKLNKALDEIVADGTYQQINSKYFPFSIY
ncbi:transporter substrate-binding domain-containing protein [Azomonas macrocytogenes]|uniref:Polar amino acid transport system substrate-binding protein n=1 Tax=Azomonas macrocytogenes TaxID=69962 RepID=A0A839T7A4_AZOMA|nr:transporter substrate-binding domain-containing protein [Azomonas macrocytogenes]MBB3105361.1 polar amino acid transport system substrate-binding protein [Azomonas macrocytogenes]